MQNDLKSFYERYLIDCVGKQCSKTKKHIDAAMKNEEDKMFDAMENEIEIIEADKDEILGTNRNRNFLGNKKLIPSD